MCDCLFRAEKFGVLIPADDKDLKRDVNPETIIGTLSWCKIGLSYPCKTKSSNETEKSFLKFLEPSQAPKIVCTDNSMGFGKASEVLSRNHRTSTPHRSETKCHR